MTRHDVRVAALLDELNELERRLDPEAHRKGQRIADLITVAVAVPLIVVLGLSIERPLLLFGLMLLALLLNRIPLWWSRHKLQAAHEKLFREYSEMVALADSSET